MGKGQWIDRRGTSKYSALQFRASKHNPYICDHCGYRSTRLSNMVRHLEKVHGDYSTDPRVKNLAVKRGLTEVLRQWKAL